MLNSDFSLTDDLSQAAYKSNFKIWALKNNQEIPIYGTSMELSVWKLGTSALETLDTWGSHGDTDCCSVLQCFIDFPTFLRLWERSGQICLPLHCSR